MNAAASRTLQPLSQFEKIALAKRIVEDEAQALQHLSSKLPARFDEAVELVCNCQGSVIVIGIGKAGWVGQKMSATLASTGTRSHFLHPAEAIHGDLGRIASDDVVVLISNSGETEEVTRLLNPLAKRQIKCVAITGRENSALAKGVDCVLAYDAVQEACPLGLAPTTSAIVMMAIGDALALVASQIRGFGAEDFGHFHPGGSLGRKLASVDEIMRPIRTCRVARIDETVREIYVRLSGPERRSGALIVMNDANQLVGIFTDSDLARLLERQQDGAFDGPIGDVMTCQPTTIQSGTRVEDAVALLGDRNLSELPVINENREPVGMIDVTDLVSLLPAK